MAYLSRARFFLMAVMGASAVIMQAPSAYAVESAWQSADYMQARLVSATDAVGEGDVLHAALEVRLENGWHSYWRMPGESGLPPSFDWSASDNVKDVAVNFLPPRRFEEAGLQTFGYDGTTFYPLTVTPQDAGQPVTIGLTAQFLVCKDICVPQTIALTLPIPDGAAQDSRYKRVIDNAHQMLPRETEGKTLVVRNFVLGPEALVLQVYAQRGFDLMDVFVESGEDVYITAVPEITVDDKERRLAMIRIAAPEGIGNLVEILAGQDLTLTITDGREAIQKKYSL